MARSKNFMGICPSQVACDGADLHAGRTVCGPCEDKLRKKAKAAKQKALLECETPKATLRRQREMRRALEGDEI
jgi:hypothetical protein